MKILRITALLGLLIALPCCQSVDDRQPIEDYSATPLFDQVLPKEICVLVPDAAKADADNAALERENIVFPADEFREDMRLYLIRRKNYAVPTSAFVDETLGGGAAGRLSTDAVLEVRIDRFDTEQLAGRGIVYVEASFRLMDGKGEQTLWSYHCRDRQIPVPSPFGGSSIPNNLRAAARRLAEDALSRLPVKR